MTFARNILIACCGLIAIQACGTHSAHRAGRGSAGDGGSDGGEASGKAGDGADGPGTMGGAGVGGVGGAESASGAGDGGDGATGGSIGADPYFSNVVLLMHFDGTNAATTFTDVKGHTVTPYGAAKLAATTSVFGGASGAFDGTSAYLTLDNSNDWNFGGGDFTVELFVYFTGGVPGQLQIPTLFGLWGPMATNDSWELLYTAKVAGVTGFNHQTDGTLQLLFSTTGSDEVIPAVAWVPAADTWHHIAAVRHGGDFLYFVDGALVGMKSIDAANDGVPDWTRSDPASNAGDWLPGAAVGAAAAIHANTSARLSIGVGVGAPGTVNSQSFLTGYIDEARITKGVARYTAAFTPPSAAFPDD
jgi:Concanavalin A-like lectin/glucanases superfamily